MKPSGIRLALIVAVLAVGSAYGASAGADPATSSTSARPRTPIAHFIMLMQENHTFDNYFGTYPGATGLPPDVCMPLDPSKPAGGCVKPFHIGQGPIQDLAHTQTMFRIQYDRGRMDGFVYGHLLQGADGRIAMGYYDRRDLPFYWNLADRYVLFDHLFSSTGAGSLKNHMFWIAATPGGYEEVPPQGYVNIQTIFDRLQQAGVSWKMYVQNYDPHITYRSVNRLKLGDRASQLIWAPLVDIPRFIDDPELRQHIVGLPTYFEDLRRGTLPSVAFMVPSGASEHPPGSLRAGQQFVRSLLNALMVSSSWDSSAFVLTYDDWGGWFDHVTPPQVDSVGYGFRVPGLLISPYARRGYLDHTQLDFTSFLKFIETNYALNPLTSRDASANNILSAFDFSQLPRPPEIVKATVDAGAKTRRPPTRMLIALYATGLLFGLALILRPSASGFFSRRMRNKAELTPGPGPPVTPDGGRDS